MTTGETLTAFVAAFLTLAIFSFLYKDNPVYKFAEHLFVGVAAGYYIMQQYKDTIIPKLWEHVRGDEPETLVRIGAGVLGFLILLRLWPRMSWLARWPIAFLVGAYAGLRLVSLTQSEIVAQVDNLIMAPLWSGDMPLFALREDSVIGNALIILGVVTVLLHFFFSAERGPVLKAASRIGIVFLMVTFGAAFGFTVLGRVSLLLGRARDLQSFRGATVVAAALVIGLIVRWELTVRARRPDGAVRE
jgi:hypothetical protein